MLTAEGKEPYPGTVDWWFVTSGETAWGYEYDGPEEWVSYHREPLTRVGDNLLVPHGKVMPYIPNYEGRYIIYAYRFRVSSSGLGTEWCEPLWGE
jgi:hypothetical protein